MNTQDKLVRVVEYLQALARINAKIVRSLDHEDYKRVLWLHQIPVEEKYCYYRAREENDDSGDEVWIEGQEIPQTEASGNTEKSVETGSSMRHLRM